MPDKRTLLLLAELILLLYVLILAKAGLERIITKQLRPPEKIERLIDGGIGEKITYEVKFGKLNLGTAVFSQLKNVKFNGRLLNVMLLETKLAHFTDRETIYLDAQTFLPVKIERDILNWFTKEKITEDYDQKNFSVTIKKQGLMKKGTLVIKKDGPIQNAVVLPQYVRHIVKLEPGRILVANLPTRRYEIELVSVDEITVPAGNFKAYHFQSRPKQIEIWISADQRRIPLKILSTARFGYSMEFKKYAH